MTVAPTPPLTPDFYDYRWHPLSSARLTETGVEAGWDDGVTLSCHRWWLRENAVVEGSPGIDPVTRETTLDLATMPADLLIDDVAIDGGALQVRFAPEQLVAVFHPGWLRHVAEGRHVAGAHLPPVEVWTTDRLDRPPTRDGSEALTNDRVLSGWLDDLVRFGLARLENVGTDDELVARLVGRVGALRASNFGTVWHVDVDPDPVSTANTTMRLPAHTDLPTRETPPGFQFLHCVANTVDGGDSTMTDGLAVVRALQAHEPDVVEALTTLPWVFFNRSKTDDHRWTGPFIDQGDGRVPYTFRGFHPVRAFPAMADADVERAYLALRRFGELANDHHFQMRYRFRPGDIVAFDNRRVFHGRESFLRGHGGGRRRLHGTYMDTDEVYSRVRVLTRHGVYPDPRTTLGPDTTSHSVPTHGSIHA